MSSRIQAGPGRVSGHGLEGEYGLEGDLGPRPMSSTGGVGVCVRRNIEVVEKWACLILRPRMDTFVLSCATSISAVRVDRCHYRRRHANGMPFAGTVSAL